MSKKVNSTKMTKKQIENTVRGVLYTVLIILGLAIAYIYWFGAAFSLCGISGCSGGGFGVSYNPEAVKSALLWSGIVAAAAPLLIFFISKFKWWWLVIALVTLVATPLIGATLIGAGLDGYPKNRINNSSNSSSGGVKY